MVPVQPATPLKLNVAVMSDLGLSRHPGYADLPEANALGACLDREQADHRANGIHLIVVQSADGSHLVGDSHHYGNTRDPFASASVTR